MRTLLLAWLLLALLGGGARAHDGETHDAPGVPPPAAGAGLETREAQSELYEVLLKYPRPVPGEKIRLRVLVSDYKSNAPVAGAAIEVVMGDLKATAAPSASAGIYEAEVTFPAAGTYEPVVSISRGEDSDLQTLPEITVAAPASPLARAPGWLIPAGVTAAAALIVLALALWWRARAHWPPGEQAV